MIKHICRLGVLAAIIIQYSHATTFWPADLPGNVTDDDIVITGDVILPPGITTVTAATRSITIMISNDIGEATVSGSPFGQSELHLVEVFPWTVNLVANQELTFRGSPGNLTTPLIILLQNDSADSGTIHIEVKEGKNLTFDSGETTSGVELYIDYTNFTLPKVIFEVHDTESRQIRFNRHCKFGYRISTGFSPYLQEVVFDAVNAPDHLALFEMHDGATFVLQDIGFIP